MNIKKTYLLFFLFSILSNSIIGFGKDTYWEQLPPLPDDEGFAGMFAGVSHGALICVGGANFPGKKPWEGGEKKWYDNVYVLKDVNLGWKVADQKLPTPLGYGVSGTFEDRFYIVGGSNELGHSSSVYSLSYTTEGIIVNDNIPDLPIPLANMSGTIIDGTIFIIGGQISPLGLSEDVFLFLDLKVPADQLKWEKGPKLPGKSRIQAVVAGHNDQLYVFSGFHLTRGENGGLVRHLLTDAYRYNPGNTQNNSTWQRLKDLPRGVAAAPSPGFSINESHIIIAGGLDDQTLTHTNPATHPGFLDKMLALHTQSGEWIEFGDMPKGTSRVTAPSVFWNGTWIVPSGERGPGVRSPEVTVFNTRTTFGWVNWGTLSIYLFCMIGIGFYFSKKENSTNEFFLAGGRIPWWAAGLSIFGTQLSAITFMAVPVIVYATDWRLAIGSIMIFAIVPFIVKYYLPFFRRLNITTAYQYLELRFNVNVRLLGSITFILLQLARMGVVVYLPSIAISSVTGLDIFYCIFIMGLFSTVYTVMGGIEAVIWTDVVQVVVLLGGALASLVIALSEIDGGLTTVIDIGMSNNKFRLIEWTWDYTQLVFWVAIIGFFFLNLISYSSDQVVIQRYLTVKNEKAAAKSLWINGLITLPGVFLFFGLGTVLYVYYLTNPEKIGATHSEELLPFYIVSELPIGLAGVVIAGIFAASMSSLDSSMNSVATAYITDIHKRFFSSWNDKKNLNLAKIITVIMGVFGTVTAIWIAVTEVGFIFDLFQKLLGMIGGCLAGVFILAIFTQRANASGAIIGTLSGALITFLISYFTAVNGYLYGAIGVISCVTIGYFTSILIPNDYNNNNEFTYKSMVKKPIG
nr:sodium/solute symporter [Cytophagales bacterium]